MDDQSNNQPPKQEREYGFGDNLKVGLGIGAVPFLVGPLFLPGANGTLACAGIAIALWALITWRTVARVSSKKFAQFGALTLGAWLCIAMMGLNGARTVSEQMNAATVAAEFARSDYGRFDARGADAHLIGAQLQQVVARQTQLKSAIEHVDAANAAAGTALGDDPLKGLTDLQLRLVKETLRTQLLPDDVVARAAVVTQYACAAGTKVGDACNVTAADLMNFRAKTEQQFAVWLVIIRFFGGAM